MKNQKCKAMVACLLIVGQLFCCVATIGAQAGNGSADIEYYGRSRLETLPNNAALVDAYDRVAAGVAVSLDTISLKTPVTLDEIRTVYEAYAADHPEHFWLSHDYGVGIFGDYVTTVYPEYELSGSELKTAKQRFQEAVDQILSGMNKNLSEFEKELYLHDTLAKRTVYQEGTHAHDAYGVLVDGQAVCEGYTKAFQYLLQLSGIQSYMVIGYGYNASGGAEMHSWNLVRIDGKYYYTDLTWDDQDVRTFHAYFNLTRQEMERDHAIFESAIDLPQAIWQDAMYFNVMGGIVTAPQYSLDVIAAGIDTDSLMGSVYILGDSSSFPRWLQSNMGKIVQMLDLFYVRSYSYYSLGREWAIVLHADASQPDPEPDTPDAPETDVPETDAPETDAPETDEPQVQSMLGDINGDGVKNTNDAIYLLRHVLLPERFPTNGEVDMDGDGELSSSDALYLLRHILLPDQFQLMPKK